MHSLRTLLTPLLMPLALAATAVADVIDVDQVNLTFVPQDILVNEGDTVVWRWASGNHTVSEGTDGSVNGNEAFHSALTSSVPTFSVTFDAAFLAANPRPGNRYDYFCAPHFNFGMVGSVTVCSPPPTTYCTPSTTSIPGCSATMSSSGVASLSNATGFEMTAGPAPGSNLGLMYFSDKGRASIPFGTQGGLVCAQPGFRSKPKGSGGTKDVCDGAYTFTLADLDASSNGVILAGNTINAAVWFRDPASPDTFALSNGIEFTICP
jgi:plastocyanin